MSIAAGWSSSFAARIECSSGLALRQESMHALVQLLYTERAFAMPASLKSESDTRRHLRTQCTPHLYGRAGGNDFLAQASPVNPETQMHVPFAHAPLPEQPLGQLRIEQWSPVQPVEHKHDPFTDLPCWHTGSSQSDPSHPEMQWHAPSMQAPLLEHILGQHADWEQSSCPKFFSHTHDPSTHLPCPEHPLGQANSPQLAPV